MSLKQTNLFCRENISQSEVKSTYQETWEIDTTLAKI